MSQKTCVTYVFNTKHMFVCMIASRHFYTKVWCVCILFVCICVLTYVFVYDKSTASNEMLKSIALSSNSKSDHVLQHMIFYCDQISNFI